MPETEPKVQKKKPVQERASSAKRTAPSTPEKPVDVDQVLKEHLHMDEKVSKKLEQASGGASKAVGALLGILVALVAATVVGLVVMGVGIYRFNWQDEVTLSIAKVVPFPIAIVDTTFLTYSDYINDFNTLKNYYVTQSESNPLLGEVSDEEIFGNIKTRMVDEAIIEHIAGEMDVTVTDEEIEAEWSVITGAGTVTDDEITQTLSELYGWTPAEFRTKVIRPFVLRQNVTVAVAGNTAAQAEKRARAEEVLALVQKGEKSFEELAKEYGEDGTATSGGDLGYFERGTMIQEFQDAVEALEVGQVSGIVETQFGYHIIKLEDKVPVEATDEAPAGEATETLYSYNAKHILILFKSIDDLIAEKKETLRLYEFF